MELSNVFGESCAARCPEDGHVLVLQDTSEVNYNNHNGRFKVNDPDLGVLSNNKSTGLLLHAGLAVSAHTQLPFGIAHAQVEHRPFERVLRTSLEREMLPLEEKESYRWLETMQQSRRVLKQAASVTMVGDRESDIYELFAERPDRDTHLLVRSHTDRRTVNGDKLSDCLARSPWQGSKIVAVSANEHRSARQAVLQVRYTSVMLPPPAKRKSLLQDYSYQQVWLVELLETPDSVPPQEDPIHWRLLTTHSATSLEDALQISEWYTLRWLIEELFRILKQGLNVEESQFERGAALKKLLLLSLQTSWKILLMKQERQGNNQQDASACFSSQQVDFLQAMQPQLEGSTAKQCNPHPSKSLAWAAWLIARLGGWKPSPLDKRPFGVVSLARGMQAFQQRWQGWQMAQQYAQNPQTFPT